MSTDKEQTPKRKAVKSTRTGRVILSVLNFPSTVGPMIIGLVIGGGVGIAAAIWLGFSIMSGLLIGAGVGFLIAIILQAMLIGGP